uniref:Excinuclease cho n=1 Tax=uncultured Thiotrichaceae bacterium TaxID=298394 RepID=A0A6S6UMR9_9GAMM|nr:MAG: DNA polymerase III epsilon subunit (EC [uncultured Thiotrichaceae bacterium]
MAGKHASPNDNPQLDWLSEPAGITENNTEKLCAGFPEKMVLLDCETTGLKPTVHRMIEVALLVIEQGEIIEQWQTLIDPSAHIPPEIRRITGISPEQLVGAPDFKSIADELLERLEGRVLVAHNARFDYGFLKNEFSRAGIQYNTKPLCSVKVSRRLFPQYKRHGLSEIIKRFNFNIDNRHRALDDTLMIWKLFLEISTRFDNEKVESTCNQLLERPSLPIHLDAAEVEKLPNTPGVYYFYDSNDKLLYVGKSVNIRTRVMSHFTQDHRNNKDLQMSAVIAHIDFETTPSDFGAQLRESHQIKALSPYYNRRLRKVRKLYHYQMEADESGYLCLYIRTIQQAASSSSDMDEQFGLFRSHRQAENQLGKLAEHFFLCQKLCGLETKIRSDRKPCFGYQLKRCLGACCAKETADVYNQRVHIALQSYRHKAWLWPDAILVEERGLQAPQTDNQPAWHLLHEWRYIKQLRSPDELYDHGYQPKNQGEKMPESATSEDNGTAQDQQLDFDLDTYHILVRFLLNPAQQKANGLHIIPLTRIRN